MNILLINDKINHENIENKMSTTEYDMFNRLFEEVNRFPVLDIGNRRGSTDYIDFITMDDVSTNSIMHGIDRFKRKFIVIKLIVEDEKIILQTIFQRYSDNKYEWRGCGHGSPDQLLFNPWVAIRNPQLEVLFSLLNDEDVLIDNNPAVWWDLAYENDYIGKTVSLFNQEKWDAAIFIQRKWRLCRYEPEYEMIDAQLTTEIFGLFAPARPDIALKMAHLPIQTTARYNAEWASEFYVIMYSLASYVDENLSMKEKILWMTKEARKSLPNDSYSAKMLDYVLSRFEENIPWEQVRDELYTKYQVNQEDGYNMTLKIM